MLTHLTLRAAGYSQMPAHAGGFLSQEDFAVADDFVLSRDTKVRQITWWGEGVADSASKQFKIRLFSDDQGQPGVLLLEIAHPSILKRKTGDFLIREGHEEESLYPEFQYTAVFSHAFLAKAGVKYWVSVVNETANQWTWEVSGSQENLGVQRSIFADPVYGPWTLYDYNYPNTAFVIGPIRKH